MINALLDIISETQKICREDLSAEPVLVGFSSCKKFRIYQQTDGRPCGIFFAKVVNTEADSKDKKILEIEFRNLSMLNHLGLGSYFPKVVGFYEGDSFSVLLVELLSNVKWGVDWTLDEVVQVRNALGAVHSLIPSPAVLEDFEVLNQIRKSTWSKSPLHHDGQKTEELFWRSIDNHTLEITNFHNEVYFRSLGPIANDIIRWSNQCNCFSSGCVIIGDLNADNIAIGNDVVRFVDLVAIKIGNPNFDLTLLAVTALRSAKNAIDYEQIFEYVKNELIKDKAVLACLIKYWIASASFKVEPQFYAWTKFQQSYAVAALKIWERVECEQIS